MIIQYLSLKTFSGIVTLLLSYYVHKISLRGDTNLHNIKDEDKVSPKAVLRFVSPEQALPLGEEVAGDDRGLQEAGSVWQLWPEPIPNGLDWALLDWRGTDNGYIESKSGLYIVSSRCSMIQDTRFIDQCVYVILTKFPENKVQLFIYNTVGNGTCKKTFKFEYSL